MSSWLLASLVSSVGTVWDTVNSGDYGTFSVNASYILRPVENKLLVLFIYVWNRDPEISV